MQATDQKYCRYLRAKNAFGTLEGGDQPFRKLDTGITTYWCLRTQAAYGPDGGFVHLSNCGRTERKCFREPKPEEA